MSLGYRGHPEWRDMSEYVVHFCAPTEKTGAYDVLISILIEQLLQASGPFGAARKLFMLGESQKSACFSEIPLDLLDRLIARRSPFGLGFLQDFLIEAGGGRVWYLDKDGEPAGVFQKLIDDGIAGGINPSDAIWRLTPFVDFPGQYGETIYEFEWEREWRVPASLSFSPEDVRFLFVPEEMHLGMKGFLSEVAQHGGATYVCPLVDPRWPIERIQEAVADLASPTPSVISETLPSDTWGELCTFCGGQIYGGQCLGCGEIVW